MNPTPFLDTMMLCLIVVLSIVTAFAMWYWRMLIKPTETRRDERGRR